MLNDMPLNYLGEFSGNKYKLEDIFGFIDCIIETPKDIKYPLLIYNDNSKNIHPTGKWKGIYFSEEIKAVVKHGYKVKITKIYQFTRAKLFQDYIDHFYNKKKFSKGADRFIAKLHLNSLYGMFGRKLDMLKTIPTTPKDLTKNLLKYPTKSIIRINDNLELLLVYNNLDNDIIKDLNLDLSLNLFNHTSLVKSNVAIASAITSYSRIEMMKYKTLPDIDIYYTDTDSIFVNKPLSDNFIGKDLGLMKDELDGGFIKEAYFFGIKKYAFIDNNDKVKSVFSGIERNSLSATRKWN